MAWRAFWFAARDAAADLLKGLPSAEEVQDIPANGNAPKSIDPDTGEIAEKTAALPVYSDADFEKNLPAWRKLIEAGRKTAGEVIFTVSSKWAMTEEQMEILKATVVATTIDAE